jgi:hypothetical protein
MKFDVDHKTKHGLWSLEINNCPVGNSRGARF